MSAERAKDVKLTRNLRKVILRGQPWIYRAALEIPSGMTRAQLVRLVDNKDKFLAWCLYSPKGPLACRVLSLDREKPNPSLYRQRFEQALLKRASLRRKDNNVFRLVNGEGDDFPGMIIDVYDQLAVMQFDGPGCFEFWDQQWFADLLLEQEWCDSVYLKPRHDFAVEAKTWGTPVDLSEVPVLEEGAKFLVDVEGGQKTGFFIDQRSNRHHVRRISSGKSVLNLFSYSGGFSINAGLGGATEVCSVDMAAKAIEMSQTNWHINGMSRESHRGQVADVFEFLKESIDKYDVVICDPPSLAKSEKAKPKAIEAYTECFASCAKLVKVGGDLVLSSCSSHISFSDFEAIVTEALSKARRRGQVIRFSGQGIDHPYPQAGPELRYLKFMHLALFD
ncbi:MAG: hypothetical protein CL675_06420 [Bdellovibrionaceae bacterium]|nr:hypothetical protein [Pseudobdellovibrionaceae bacterium]|tara:strand:+ start:71 stop:1246 length:1176 start_codon:yes stop_codon:yes gene_type:complete